MHHELPENYTQNDIKVKKIIGWNNDFLQSNENGIVTNVNLSTTIRVAGSYIIETQFIQNHLDKIKINLVVSSSANKKISWKN